MPNDYGRWLQQEVRKHAQIAQALRKRKNMDALDDIIDRYTKVPPHEADHANFPKLHGEVNFPSPLSQYLLDDGTEASLERMLEVGKRIVEAAGPGKWPQLKPGNINCLQHASVEYLVMEYARMCRLPDCQIQPAEREFFDEVEERLLWPDGTPEAMSDFRSRVAKNDVTAQRLVHNAIRRADTKKMLGPLKAQPIFLPEELKDYPFLPIPYQHNGLSSNETVLLQQDYASCCSQIAEGRSSLPEAALSFVTTVENQLEWPANGAGRVRSLNKFRQQVNETSEDGNKARVLAMHAISSAPVEVMRKRLKPAVPAKQPTFLDEWHTLARKLKGAGGGVTAVDVAAMLEALPQDLRPDWRVAEVIEKATREVWWKYHREMQTDTGGSEVSPFLRHVEDYVGVTDRQKFRNEVLKTVRDLMTLAGPVACLDHMPEMKTACLKEACRYLDDKDKSGTRKHLTQAVLCGLLPKEALNHKS